ncbi:hypothetical protein ABN028_23490 [Actinopolymorpha sp. B17G11]
MTLAVLALVDPFTRAVFFRILTEHEPKRSGSTSSRSSAQWRSF